jgi:hypothetical protein
MNPLSPKIEFLIDPKADIDRFNFFLNDPNRLSKRMAILNFYPKLADRLRTEKNQQAVVEEVLLDMYERFDNQIKEMVNGAKDEFSKSSSIFTVLAQKMDYPELAEQSYIAIPTFLPFSPFKHDTFYFSIAKNIAGAEFKPRKIIEIAIHEISHFIFYGQLELWEQNHNKDIESRTRDYFKEALTASIMNTAEFRESFGYLQYRGNPELHNITINHDNKKYNIVDFFGIIMDSFKYSSSLDKLLTLFSSKLVQQVFTKKAKLWNEMAQKNQDCELLKEYKKPIVLNI